MLIRYARVSKADGSQSLDLQRDAMRTGDRLVVWTRGRPADTVDATREHDLRRSIYPALLTTYKTKRRGEETQYIEGFRPGTATGTGAAGTSSTFVALA